MTGWSRLRDPRFFAAAGDADGREWIDALPGLMDSTCREWDLIVAGPPGSGFHSMTLPVTRRGEPCLLKLVWPNETAAMEILALETWDGQGAVRLLDASVDQGMMLLEQLDASRPLTTVSLMEAAAIAGQLIRQLAIPAPPGPPRLGDVAGEIADSLLSRDTRTGRTVPQAWAEDAASLARQLSSIRSGGLLVHTDLHYGNILAGDRDPWLAIDPKPAVGDPERAVAELLWTRADELNSADDVRALLRAIVAAAGLDAERARAWGIVRTIDYWLWGLEHGLTEDSRRCRAVAAALLAY